MSICHHLFSLCPSVLHQELHCSPLGSRGMWSIHVKPNLKDSIVTMENKNMSSHNDEVNFRT